ncbi:MAG: LPS export ABC transporter periplasmic protein LptC [Pseudomonadota bacterium]|nr:LPS export ABC transporter periplasmic protein LptC [Pseudomonadales bacterium]MDY6918948.1 LPS export ABC transporter periplasmic protein LptC [Pseudomonadota bacterium]
MKPKTQLILTSLLLGLMVVGLYAYVMWDQWFQPRANITAQNDQPDMVAKNLVQQRFDDQGAKSYRLQAESMEQFISRDRNVMARPIITFFEQQQPSWRTRADTAVSDTKVNRLDLTGNVSIEQQGVSEAAVMETQTLALYPRRSYATTDDRVVIRQTGVYIEATGLDADLTNNRITLKTNVTSIYDPEKS